MVDAAGARSPRRQTSRPVRALILGLWFVGISIPLATLAVQHDLPFVRRTPHAGAEPTAGRRPTVRHVLAADCPCSGAVADRLVARGADATEREDVWVIGHAPDLVRRLSAAGYTVRQAAAADALDTLGVVGAPFLLIYGESGEELYAGGYAPRRPREAGDVEVDAILRSVRAGGVRLPRPAYGCVVGEDLRRQVDPLRLKYGRTVVRSES